MHDEIGLPDIDLTDLDRFTAGFPHRVFDVLRRDAPAWFHPATAHTPGGEGFWVLSRYADIVGRSRVIAGTDCGFGTFAGAGAVHPPIAFAKLAAMTEGAAIATRRLWGR